MHPNDTTQEIPYGYCKCGCGRLAPIATITKRKYGWRKGQPLRFVHGHNSYKPIPPPPVNYCECGCGQPTLFAKKAGRGYKRGQRFRFVNGHNRSSPAEIRFWEKVDKNGPNGCWLWTDTLNANGYGRLGIGDEIVMAHRFSFELHYGPIPNGLGALHKCDNPRCVNPDHLFLGTQADNIADMVAKGRGHRKTK